MVHSDIQRSPEQVRFMKCLRSSAGRMKTAGDVNNLSSLHVGCYTQKEVMKVIIHSEMSFSIYGQLKVYYYIQTNSIQILAVLASWLFGYLQVNIPRVLI